ncbi:dTDP-4-dehydrorhamnose reductase [Vaginella massiliensis]|uniref:dTDP-4-dehydrorhamnose reductase n=1 Tax=Vaginella massiliensis TaxID=1816680 RepID=UPI0008385251|nr:dTDP-4-dehydrorhamnose reductase [Vaginella massiliensis]
MKRILVTGANGQLGQSIHLVSTDYPDFEFYFKTSQELDITNETLVKQFFQENPVDIVINTAAYTAVDKAEENRDNAYRVNAVGTKILGEQTKQFNIPLVHISTDYVFDGSVATPRLESDPTNPIGVYGKTKLAGEHFALASNPKTIILRTAWVYSRFGNNFVKTMLRLFDEKSEIGIINDQIGSPTNAIDLAKAILDILSHKELTYGIFNYSNEGKCSWFEFASKIKEFTNSSIQINPIPTSAYPTPAKRPAYSLLDKSKIKNTYRLAIPHWEESLKVELKEM